MSIAPRNDGVITRHPAENFIKFLMTGPHPSASNNDWIQMMLTSYGFPSPDTDYLIKLRADIMSRMPDNFQRNNPYHRPSKEFMRKEGIYGLHNPDKASREATLILANLRVRQPIEDLILGRMDPKDIAKKINARYAEFLTADGIRAYKHYYWNVDLLRVEDWQRLLSENNSLRNSALAITQIGASMALHKAGFQQNVESKTMLKSVQEALYFDFLEWKAQPHSSEKTKSMTNIAKSIVMLDMQLNQADTAMKDSLKAFEQFRMETAKEKVKGLKEIAPAGNFTGSGAKLLEAPRPNEPVERKSDEG